MKNCQVKANEETRSQSHDNTFLCFGIPIRATLLGVHTSLVRDSRSRPKVSIFHLPSVWDESQVHGSSIHAPWIIRTCSPPSIHTKRMKRTCSRPATHAEQILLLLFTSDSYTSIPLPSCYTAWREHTPSS